LQVKGKILKAQAEAEKIAPTTAKETKALQNLEMELQERSQAISVH